MSGLPVAEIVARSLDRSRPSSERRTYAQRLAGTRTPEALQALVEGFRLEEGVNRRVLAQLMGQTREPAFAEPLASLLETGNEVDASVAIRALAAIGGDTNTRRLAGIMKDDGWPDALRTEAALEWLNTGNDEDALAAIRGLTEIGGDENTDKLAEVVTEDGTVYCNAPSAL
jgi:HEAT repeat protein